MPAVKQKLFVFPTVCLKIVSAKDSAGKKHMMCTELKKEMMTTVRVVNSAKQYERSASTVCTLLSREGIVLNKTSLLQFISLYCVLIPYALFKSTFFFLKT